MPRINANAVRRESAIAYVRKVLIEAVERELQTAPDEYNRRVSRACWVSPNTARELLTQGASELLAKLSE